tara:strand:- start:725 stop:1171 length:447 start_codon:yes stop_codon:yes gene_type:complete
MIKNIAVIAALIIAIVIETSFISSLPDPLCCVPLVLALAVYLIQYRGSKLGTWWLAGYGFYLDYMQIGIWPVETLIWLVIGILSWLLSQRLFTNRSLYGILSCGLFAFFLSNILHLTFFYPQTLWELLFLILSLSVLSYLSDKIKKII